MQDAIEQGGSSMSPPAAGVSGSMNGSSGQLRDLRPDEVGALPGLVTAQYSQYPEIVSLERVGVTGEGSNCMLIALMNAMRLGVPVGKKEVPFPSLSAKAKQTAAQNMRKVLLERDYAELKDAKELKHMLATGEALHAPHLVALCEIFEVNVFVLDAEAELSNTGSKVTVRLRLARRAFVQHQPSLLMYLRAELQISDLRPFGGPGLPQIDVSGHFENTKDKAGRTMWDSDDPVTQVRECRAMLHYASIGRLRRTSALHAALCWRLTVRAFRRSRPISRNGSRTTRWGW